MKLLHWLDAGGGQQTDTQCSLVYYPSNVPWMQAFGSALAESWPCHPSNVAHCQYTPEGSATFALDFPTT